MTDVCPGPVHRVMGGLGVLVALCGAVCTTSPAMARQAPAPPDDSGAAFLLLDRALHVQKITLTGLSERSISYLDVQKAERSTALNDVAAIVPRWWSPGETVPEGLFGDGFLAVGLADAASGEAGLLELTDGERLVGRPVDSAEGTGEVVEWENPALGHVRVRLDDISRIRMARGGATPAAPAKPDGKSGTDRLVMSNGDVVTGFVESISSTVIIDADGRKVRAPIDQVAEVRLSAETRAPNGARAWLRDGSVVNVARFTGNAHDGLIEFEPSVGSGSSAPIRGRTATEAAAMPSSRPAMIATADLLAVAPDSARVVALASLKTVREEPVEGRRQTEPVRSEWGGLQIGLAESTAVAPLGASDLVFPGPMLVEWELPAGAERVAGWAEMPRENWDWGDCVLVMGVSRADGRFVEMARERINADKPVYEFNLDLGTVIGIAPQRFRAVIEPGEHGPIQDRVVLKRALVGVAKAAK